MPTPNVKDIMASINKTPTTNPVVLPTETHENTSTKDGEKPSSDATASPEANFIALVDSSAFDEALVHKVDEVKGFDKNKFLADVRMVLKTKMDSMDLKNAMADITNLLG